MKNAKYYSIVLPALCITIFTGCVNFKSTMVKTDRLYYRITAEGKKKISLNEVNGEIRITNVNDSDKYVKIEAQKYVRADEEDKTDASDNLTVIIDSSGSEIKVTTKIDQGMFKIGDIGYVDYNIYISQAMSVRIDNVNGDIFLNSIEGDALIETINAAIYLAGCSGNIKVDGVNADIYSNFDSTKGVSIDLVNGDIRLGGLKTVNAEVSISTINGDLEFNGLNFGNISIGGKRSFKGILGIGGNMINISTVNGDINFDANYISFPKVY
jgi:hypothetical protein